MPGSTIFSIWRHDSLALRRHHRRPTVSYGRSVRTVRRRCVVLIILGFCFLTCFLIFNSSVAPKSPRLPSLPRRASKGYAPMSFWECGPGPLSVALHYRIPSSPAKVVPQLYPTRMLPLFLSSLPMKFMRMRKTNTPALESGSSERWCLWVVLGCACVIDMTLLCSLYLHGELCSRTVHNPSKYCIYDCDLRPGVHTGTESRTQRSKYGCASGSTGKTSCVLH